MKISNIDSPTYLKWSKHPRRWVTEKDEQSVYTGRKGVLRCADGTEFKCLLFFCETDSNEHNGTGVLVAEDPECFADDATSIVWQGEPGFCERLGKTKKQVFPYKYKYEGPRCDDHHIGEDGWSL
jgi:hypothetical protein